MDLPLPAGFAVSSGGPGGFQVQVGDSSALAGLPLRGGFTVATGKS